MTERQAILNYVFTSIQNRYNTFFFSKIFLSLSQLDEENCDHVRHYDKESEAVEIISDTLGTLINKNLCKAFYAIKGYSEFISIHRNRVNRLQRVPKTPKGKVTHHLDISTNSRYLENKNENQNLQITELTNEVESSISKLLGRVKNLSDRLGDENEEQSRIKKHQNSQIYQRLELLENSLSEFKEHKQDIPTKVTYSAVVNRYQQIDRKLGPSSQVADRPVLLEQGVRILQ